LKHAILERGVAHLVVPDEVQIIEDPKQRSSGPEGRMPDLRVAPPAAALRQALDRIAAATRPVIIVGAGARFDMAAIVAFAESLQASVLTTFKAKGQLSDE